VKSFIAGRIQVDTGLIKLAGSSEKLHCFLKKLLSIMRCFSGSRKKFRRGFFYFKRGEASIKKYNLLIYFLKAM
jgi:hypothetical protein